MVEHSWVHDLIDIFAVLVGILGLFGLFVEPNDPAKRRGFLKLSIIVLIVAIVGFGLYERHVSGEDQREHYERINNKETAIKSALCSQREMTFEQLYNDTSQGYADTDLNEAIDELTQKTQWLKQRQITISKDASPTKEELTVRLYSLDDYNFSGCKKGAK